jgi:hypothetical protein
MALTDAPSGRRAPAARRLPRPAQRRALELLASCPQEGCSEAVLLAHGFGLPSILLQDGQPPTLIFAQVEGSHGLGFGRFPVGCLNGP